MREVFDPTHGGVWEDLRSAQELGGLGRCSQHWPARLPGTWRASKQAGSLQASAAYLGSGQASRGCWWGCHSSELMEHCTGNNPTDTALSLVPSNIPTLYFSVNYISPFLFSYSWFWILHRVFATNLLSKDQNQLCPLPSWLLLLEKTILDYLVNGSHSPFWSYRWDRPRGWILIMFSSCYQHSQGRWQPTEGKSEVCVTWILQNAPWARYNQDRIHIPSDGPEL